MKKLNLADDSGETGASSSPNGRQKRLRIILLVVLLIGAAAIAAQQFLFQEKKPAFPPMRPRVATLPPSPPVYSPPSVKPSEPIPPSPATPPAHAPSFPPVPVREDQAKELPKPSTLPVAPGTTTSSMRGPGVFPPSPATAPASTPSAAAPSSKPEAIEEPKTSKSPLKTSAEDRKALPAHGYSLQVLACVEEKNARENLQKLKAEGFSPAIVKAKATLTKHSVYIGDFSGPEEAASLGTRLQADGISAILFTAGGGRYSFLISSYSTLNEAIDASHELEKKGYPARIQETTARTSVYQVRTGHFANRGQAAAPIQRLRDLGYSPVLVKE